MTEQSIFEILLGSDNQDNRDINPLLVPDAAAIICNGLAVDVNVTAKNPSYSPHYMRDSLVLISNLCKNYDEHYQVNSKNKSFVLSCLKKTYRNQNEDDMEELIDECVQEIKMTKKAILDGIKKKVIEKREAKYQKTELILETIRKKIKELELSSRLEFKEMTIQTRKHLMYKTLESETKIENGRGKLEKTDDYRLKHIKFGYAVLIVGHKEEVSTHLSVLLKDLCRYKVLHNYEKRFCKHLFRFIDQYPDFLQYYKDKFFFILEIQIIDACRDIVTRTVEDFEIFLNEELKSSEFNSLIAACKRDTLIYSKIKNMLFSLYYCSNFNERILHFLIKIDRAVLKLQM